MSCVCGMVHQCWQHFNPERYRSSIHVTRNEGKSAVVVDLHRIKESKVEHDVNKITYTRPSSVLRCLFDVCGGVGWGLVHTRWCKVHANTPHVLKCCIISMMYEHVMWEKTRTHRQTHCRYTSLWKWKIYGVLQILGSDNTFANIEVVDKMTLLLHKKHIQNMSLFGFYSRSVNTIWLIIDEKRLLSHLTDITDYH